MQTMATAREMAENKTIFGWYREEMIELLDTIDILQEKDENQLVISLAQYKLYSFLFGNDVMDVIRIENPNMVCAIMEGVSRVLEEIAEVRARGLVVNKYDVMLEGLLLSKI